MAILYLTRLRARFAELAFWQQVMLAIIGFCAILWLDAFSWFLDPQRAETITALQIDKVIHFIGGIFAAGLLFLTFNWRSRLVLILGALAIGMLWEIWEVIFLPDQLTRLHSNFLLWLFDSLFDLIADMLGAYFFAETIPRLKK